MNIDELRESILAAPKNGYTKMSEEQKNEMNAYCRRYAAFMDAAKTEREATTWAVREAEKQGFQPLVPGMDLKPGDRVYMNNRGKSILLAVMGAQSLAEGANICAAHVDSPRLDLKPNPLYEDSEIAYVKTHYYGGIKKYQWATVPLALHGTVCCKDGSSVDVIIGEDDNDPILMISDLLPHLAADQMKRTAAELVNGENLDVLIGSRPFRSDKGSELVKLNILRMLNEKYGVVESDFLSAELELVPAGKARDLGFDRSMILGYGHDDRVCAYPALTALFALENPAYTAVTVLADKEETGSDGSTGMAASFLPYFISDLAAAFGAEGRHVLGKSLCLSADVNAAFDPLYPEVMERRNASYINGGVVLTKYTGARGKSSTNDASAEVMGLFRRLMDDGKVLWQIGELGKVDQGGGGTVAKFIAALDVDTVDLGVAVLSMHAPYEVISKIDVYMAHKAFYTLLSRE